MQINSYELENLTVSPPAFESATLEDTTLTLEFDRPLGTDTEPSASWFALAPFTDGNDCLPVWGHMTQISVESAWVSGEKLILQLAPSVPEDVCYTLTYTPPDMGGLVGDTGKAVTGLSEAVDVDNVTDYAPFPVTLVTNKMGKTVSVTFDQRLDPSVSPDAMWFSLDPEHKIHDVIIDSGSEERVLLITLDTTTKDMTDMPDMPDMTDMTDMTDGPIRENSDLKLTYKRPASGGLRDDDAPNDVEGFTLTVQNDVDVAPQLESVTVNGDVITIEFDQDLDENSVPPANCQELEDEGHIDSCALIPQPQWFVVKINGMSSVPIAIVKVSGRTVTLTLQSPVKVGDSVKLAYTSHSDPSDRSLRDTSIPPNEVEPFDSDEADNITAVSANAASFDRTLPKIVVVKFDGNLDDSLSLDTSSLRVTVDGSPVAVAGASSSGMAATIELDEAVSECSSLALSYTPDGEAWLDAANRQIEAFSFDVPNLIDSTWGLKCVTSDYGGVELEFDDVEALNLPDFAWSLTVNGESREIERSISGQVVQLQPERSVCAGDTVAIQFSSSTPDGALIVERTISSAAPCAVSATADGVRLRVTFDAPLEAGSPERAEFEVSGNANVESVTSIDGPVLTLRLAVPGLRAGQEATLGYSGSSLRGGGLTVGTFSVLISDHTEPPQFVSGYAVGSSVFLKFDQPLLARDIPVSRFIPSGTGIEQKVKSVSVNGTSLYLELTSSLPDEPDLVALVYLAGTRGGLAGLTGSRVGDSVFLVDNYTETPPNVHEIVVDSYQVAVTFNQRIDGSDANPEDFALFAGRRRIQATAFEWSEAGVVITLAERATSLDPVLLTYAPGDSDPIRDLTGFALAQFELWAKNQTDAPDTVEETVEDAQLRSSVGGTTFERELVREFASDDSITVTITPGAGSVNVAYRELLLSVDAGDLSSGAQTIRFARLDDVPQLLELLGPLPASCGTGEEHDTVEAWWLGESDIHGVPTDHGVRVAMSGLADAGLGSPACVLDLLTGDWRMWQPGVELITPTLILTRPPGQRLNWDPMPLAR